MATQKRTTVWVDASGNTIAHNLVTSAGAGAVEASIHSVSNADVQESWEGNLTVNGSPAPVAAQYQGVRDQAVLFFSTAAGSIVKLFVPAPQASIFLADQETVDAANVSVIALVSSVIANVTTPAGVALTMFVGGSRGGG